MGQQSGWVRGVRRAARAARAGGPARSAVAWIVMVAAGIAAGGCGSRPIFGELGRQAGSYDYKGERVELRMLTGDELWNYPVTGKDQEKLRARLRDEFQSVFTASGFDDQAAGQLRARAFGLAAVVPLIAGFAVDAVRSELEKEAGIHEAQFGDTIHRSGFWAALEQRMPAGPATRPAPGAISKTVLTGGAGTDNNGLKDNGVDHADRDLPGGTFGTPRWLGFEIVRTTDATRGADRGAKYASRMVCVMVPALYMTQPAAAVSQDDGTRMLAVQNPPADPRLFVIKPLLYEARTSKAKLMVWEKKLNATVNIAMDATWIDDRQTVHQEPVAAAAFDVEDYDLTGKSIYIDELKGQIAGWFGGVPVSTAPGHPDLLNGNGTFKLAVAITERDPSRVKESIERAAKYLKDNRSQIVQQVTGTK